MEIVFARTRAEYPSYTDYWALVEACKFPICWIDDIDFQTDNTYIVSPLNGEYRPHRDNCRKNAYNAKMVSWCLERPSGTNGLAHYRRAQKELLDKGYFDEVWVSDRFLETQCEDNRIKFVILGSHEAIGDVIQIKKDFDVIHLSYTTHRRGKIYSELDGHSVKIAENAWGEQRHDRLRQTKFMLNIHQDEYGLIEPLRFALGAAYAIPIITEKCYDAYPYTRGGDGHCILEVEYGDLVGETVKRIHEDYRWLRAMGRRCHRLMVDECRFDKMVQQAARGMLMPSTLEIV